MNKPMNCSECQLRMEFDFENGECFNGCEIKLNSTPDWCPLKPLPNAINERGKWISEEYQKGWNAFRENLE